MLNATFLTDRERRALCRVPDRDPSQQRVEPELIPLTCMHWGCQEHVDHYCCGRCVKHCRCGAGEQ